MPANRFQQVETIFYGALDLPRESRQSYLLEQSGTDEMLFQEVNSLLQAYEQQERLNEHHAQGNAASAAPRRIGVYQIEQLIGKGGMGAVYLASRVDGQFERHVAIKLIALPLATDFFRERFLQERQILATLDHPNITRLLDGGLTPENDPYLVMEYVNGLPLDTYCDQHLLSIPERLRLFQQVCSAVGYAHRNLIVHRDLKPGNILVTGDGMVKLLDFGTAKLLTAARGDATTRVGLLTPRYASPEQLRGEGVTTLSDVYSLGIILYELMTSCWPYGDPASALAGLERAMGQVLPTKPNSVVTEEAAKARSTPRAKLERTLRGDLGNIVLKAIETETQRRYATVEQLSEDLDRFLDAKPVAARTQTVGYRMWRFVGRHRLPVGLAAAVTAGMITLTLLSVSQARRATRELARAEQVTSFLTEMVGATPTQSQSSLRTKGVSLRVVELVDALAEQLDHSLHNQPEAEASLRYVVGSAYREIGLYDKAWPQAKRALYLWERSAAAPDDPKRLNALALVSVLNYDFGRFDESEQQATEAARLWKKPSRYADAGLATIIGIAQLRLGKLDAAEQTLKGGLERFKASGPKDPWEGLFETDLSLVYLERGQFDLAVQHLEEAVALARSGSSGASESLGFALTSLSHAQRLLGRLDEARRSAEEALQQFNATLGESNPTTARALIALAWAKAMLKDDDAEEVARRAVAIQDARFPVGHFDRATGGTCLGFTLMQENKLKEARRVLADALEIRNRSFKAPNWQIAETAGLLGETLARQGDKPGARPLLEESRAMFQTLYGADNPRTREARARLEAWGR